MIKATFCYRDQTPVGFLISGHSGTAESGKDIVCAAITSAVMLTANTITQSFGIKAKVTVGENTVSVQRCDDPNGQKIISALKDHIQAIQSDYPDAILIRIITETEE